MFHYHGTPPTKVSQSPLKVHYSETHFPEPNQSQVSHMVGRAVPSQSIHPTVPNTSGLSKSIKIWQTRRVLIVSQILAQSPAIFDSRTSSVKGSIFIFNGPRWVFLCEPVLSCTELEWTFSIHNVLQRETPQCK